VKNESRIKSFSLLPIQRLLDPRESTRQNRPLSPDTRRRTRNTWKKTRKKRQLKMTHSPSSGGDEGRHEGRSPRGARGRRSESWTSTVRQLTQVHWYLTMGGQHICSKLRGKSSWSRTKQSRVISSRRRPPCPRRPRRGWYPWKGQCRLRGRRPRPHSPPTPTQRRATGLRRCCVAPLNGWRSWRSV